ncbi:MAG: hypothetical protein IPM59_09725 [Chloracidobacterium sp.]|nr:hypothetical protein [Chloracidobacterium sp.]
MNKYGLSRHIPEDVRRQLRQEAGFGCVVCGLAIATYEHIDPEFHEARTHDPAAMAYLCGGCHDTVTRKFWSKDKVITAKRLPECIKKGRCHAAFDIGSKGPVRITLGSNEFINVDTILAFEDEVLLSVLPPDENGQPYRLSGRFFDSEGSLLFDIEENEWRAGTGIWDIEASGGRITLRAEAGRVAAQILCNPDVGLTIERLDMMYSGLRFLIDRGNMVYQLGGSIVSLENQRFEALGRGAAAFMFQGGRMIIGRAGEVGMRVNF